MKILLDIKHPAQLNLFKALSHELASEGWDVTICYLNRGKLPKIIKSEYPGFRLIAVGKSEGTRWSIIWDGNIKRTFRFIQLIRHNKYHICLSASSMPLALACKVSRVPVIQFYDDPERDKLNRINAALSDQLFFPPIIKKTEKISHFNCLKEWSYLSTSRFKPNPKVLEKYNLVPYEYVFVREVSNKSFNYFDQSDGIVCSFSHELTFTKFVLSLEDKSIASKFPKHWTLLEEPVEDIHSLIYFSKLVISSGDSMAREGAMLGIPSVYCGIREMKANHILEDKGMLKHLPGASGINFINEHTSKAFEKSRQSELRKHLEETWDDMVQFMKNQINHYKRKE